MHDTVPSKDVLAARIAYLKALPTGLEAACETAVDALLQRLRYEKLPSKAADRFAPIACGIACAGVVATPVWPPALVIAAFAYVYGIRRMWSRRLIVLLRAFKEPGVDHALLSMSSMLQSHGRFVHLRNESMAAQTGIGGMTLPRYGAFLPIWSLLAVSVIAVVWSGHVRRDLGTVLYLGIGANALLDAWCDRRLRTAIAFFAAAAFTRWCGPTITSSLRLESWWSPFVVFAAAYMIAIIALVATPFVARFVQGAEFQETIAHPSHLQRLAREIVAPTLRRVFLKNAPRVVDPIRCLDWSWRPTVRLLVSLADRTIIDTSSLASAPGLIWEVELCKRLGVNPIYLCRADAAPATLEVLERTLGRRPTEFFTWRAEPLEVDDLMGLEHVLTTP
jgi:hypothetical protein